MEADFAPPSNRSHSTKPRQKATSADRHRTARSCIICHRRKIRCNKRLPCDNCTKTGVLCYYPSPEDAEPRKSRATIADVAERLAQLERTILAISSSDPPPSSSHAQREAPKAISFALDSNDEILPPSGLLVHDGNSSQFVDELLLAREQEIRAMLSEEATPPAVDMPEVHSSTCVPSFGHLAMLTPLRPLPLLDLDGILPTKLQALELWQTYVLKVDPLSKVLHIPTAQVKVYEAISSPETATPEARCLLFAIYFAATFSLSSSEVQNLLGKDKIDALDLFRSGLEHYLMTANALARPSITCLSALSISLHVMRALDSSRSVWILNGIAIRAAQSVGLHRDPSKFPISPFDAEMRRRLWWHIVSLDARTLEDHSLPLPSPEQNTDTQLPLAVDDSALTPSMTEPPSAPQGRWTEMTLPVLLYNSAYPMQRLCHMVQGSTPGSNDAARHQIAHHLETFIEEQLANCNPAIPIQRYTIGIGRIVLRKIKLISRQQWQLRGQAMSPAADMETAAAPPSGILDDEARADACTVLESSVALQTDELLHNFRWCAEVHWQYHVMLYLLRDLSLQPSGPTAARSWSAFEGSFRLEAARMSRQEIADASGDSSFKWRVLVALREKVMRIRDPSSNGNEPGGRETENAGGDGDAASGEALLADINNFLEGDNMLVWDDAFLDWKGLASS
ncbi:fungal specific transcription factor [Trichoderma arundinaceum]|uniref:Fungal specific transcription factor n=1 Tax=Trichoderma arundinaceum TaxID=490622 RepID=A0A395NLH5_TRIAR|nr:fungal specific transcription factor [Trichoderma arundinaceum]